LPQRIELQPGISPEILLFCAKNIAAIDAGAITFHCYCVSGNKAIILSFGYAEKKKISASN